MMISLQNVTKWYNPISPVYALNAVSLEIEKGDIVSIIGSSGSGKTTLLNVISAIDSPTSGKVLIDGKDISGFNQEDLAQFRRTTVGIVFQFFNLMPTLTIRENIMLPHLISGVSLAEASTRAERLAERVGLGHRLHQKPHTLSGGEMQRTAIARALMNRPPLLIADEPTGNLDSVNAKRVLNLLRELAQEEHKTLVIATHSEEVTAIADRVIEMKDGRIHRNSRLGALNES